MDEHEWLAERFEARRAYLQTVAYRMLGSLSKAGDALQEAWQRLSRSHAWFIMFVFAFPATLRSV